MARWKFTVTVEAEADGIEKAMRLVQERLGQSDAHRLPFNVTSVTSGPRIVAVVELPEPEEDG